MQFLNNALAIGDVVADCGLLLDNFVRVAGCAYPNQLLRAVELFTQYREHVHARMRLLDEQYSDVFAIDLDADRLL